MTLFRSLIRVTSISDAFYRGSDVNKITPVERLRRVISFTNDYIAETHGDSSMFATIFIGVIDLRLGTITYTNCGHEPPLILRRGEVVASLRPTGPLVGVIPDAVFSTREIVMENNDLLLVYTDGVTESMNAEDDFFGKARLMATLADCQKTPTALLNTIQTQLSLFIGKVEQFDDITILAAKRCE